MATRKSALEEERMTDANIAKVISMLEPPEGSEHKPWTKKECCQFLGMAYNTTRLGTILEKFKEKKARDAKRRAELRGKPPSNDEVVFIIGQYLEGSTVDSISKATYRSAVFVKNILAKHSVPIRASGNNYFTPELIPDAAVRDHFEIGEVVYSARYDSTARVDVESSHPHHGRIYRIWLLSDKWKQCAWQPAEELASLQHLRELGVKI